MEDSEFAEEEAEFSATHLILQYLHEKGHHKTLEVFQEECGIQYKSEAIKYGGHLETILFEHKELSITKELGELGITEAKEKDAQEQLLERGNGDYASTLYKSLDGLHTGNILSTAFSHSPVNNWIATGSSDKTISITDYETGVTERKLQVHQGAVLSLDWNPNPEFHHLLLSSAMDGTVAVTDVTTGRVIHKSKDHTKYVVGCKWYIDGLTFATASHDHSVAIFRCKDADNLKPDSDAQNSFSLVERYPFNANAEAITWNKEGVLVVAVREDNYLHMIDLNSSSKTRFNMNAALDNHVSFTAMALSFNPVDEDYLLVGTDKDRVILYKVGNSTPVRNFWGAPNDAFGNPKNCWHNSGKYVYSNAQDKRIYCWEVANSSIVSKLQDHHAQVRDLCQHPSKNFLASGSFDKTVKLWTASNHDVNSK